MLPLIFQILKDASGVASLIGTRIYRHGAAPQKVIAPYVTWFVVSGNPENELTSTPRVDRFNVQVDCWSDNDGSGDTGVETLAEAVRTALEPHGHLTSYAVNERDFETQRYRIGMEFTLYVHR
jgi:hypothetical protein